jgi:hypothetical protein
LRQKIGHAAREHVCERFDNLKTIEPLISLFKKEGVL